jgi:hypothetical protein
VRGETRRGSEEGRLPTFPPGWGLRARRPAGRGRGEGGVGEEAGGKGTGGGGPGEGRGPLGRSPH